MRAPTLFAMAAGCLLAMGWPVSAQDGQGEPFELVRAMQSLQDQGVQGNSRAHAAQRALLGPIAERFDSLSPARWQDARNARAAVVFVLSGGNAHVLHKLVRAVGNKNIDEKLVNGAIAYGEGRLDEAAELLTGVDARTLEAGMAGLVAYVQGELVAKKDPGKALPYFDDARLLAPGTIVEGAALRRQIALLTEAGDADRYGVLAAQYLRRFRNSVYAGGFRQQFAVAIARHTKGSEPGRLARLESVLEGVAKAERRELYLTMATEAIAKGRVDMARFAAAHAARLADDPSADLDRARLYEAAALIVTKDFDRGMAMLSALDRSKLSKADAELLDAAQGIAAQVRRSPDGPDARPPAAKGTAQIAAGPALEHARKAIAQVDEMLSRAERR